MGEAKKRGNAVCMSDEEVFGLVIHYYDEDDIKVNKISANVKTSVSTPVAKPIKLTEEDKKKAREAAIKRLTEEQYALLRKKVVTGQERSTRRSTNEFILIPWNQRLNYRNRW